MFCWTLAQSHANKVGDYTQHRGTTLSNCIRSTGVICAVRRSCFPGSKTLQFHRCNCNTCPQTEMCLGACSGGVMKKARSFPVAINRAWFTVFNITLRYQHAFVATQIETGLAGGPAKNRLLSFLEMVGLRAEIRRLSPHAPCTSPQKPPWAGSVQLLCDDFLQDLGSQCNQQATGQGLLRRRFCRSLLLCVFFSLSLSRSLSLSLAFVLQKVCMVRPARTSSACQF